MGADRSSEDATAGDASNFAAGDLHALRDTLFPAVANVTGSNLADVAFVDAHFVLIGALALPG